jgi:hypothetical protein
MAMKLWPRVVYHWGSTAAERQQPFPCDRLVARPDDAMFRALDVRATAPTLFRWLCQLRVAPYSYDRLDNGGRQSPRTLTPGLDELEVGQRVMSIFRLVEFEPGRSITVLSEGTMFGRVACSYEVRELTAERSRLLVKLLVSHQRSGIGRLPPLRALLPPGDLVMMRRQLLNLKQLAESGPEIAARVTV